MRGLTDFRRTLVRFSLQRFSLRHGYTLRQHRALSHLVLGTTPSLICPPTRWDASHQPGKRECSKAHMDSLPLVSRVQGDLGRFGICVLCGHDATIVSPTCAIQPLVILIRGLTPD